MAEVSWKASKFGLIQPGQRFDLEWLAQKSLRQSAGVAGVIFAG